MTKAKTNLQEFNPYSKKLYPKHHQIAKMLLTGKECSFSDMYDRTGLSPRTLGVVLKNLAAIGIVIEKHRDENRLLSYRASAGEKVEKMEFNPLAV